MPVASGALQLLLMCALGMELLGASAGDTPPCEYEPGNGLFWSTYGGPVQRSVVSPGSLKLIDDVLAFDYIAGIAHYQNWSTLEPRRGEYNWTVLDAAFAAAARTNKSVILGLQAGVCAPSWLLQSEGVVTAHFVHRNPGWFGWASLQSNVSGMPVITFARPWDNPAYEAALERTLRALAQRFAGHPALAYVNVVGISVSAGVEANFNVDYPRSREAIPNYDAQMNYTQATYVAGWKRRIDLHLALFPGRVGMATHDQPGDAGWEDGAVVEYTVAQKMATARAIRDHLLARGGGGGRPRPVIRNCGGSNNTAVWGEPGVTVGGPEDLPPPKDFALLLWEIRQQAHLGVEQGGIVPRRASAPAQLEFLREVLAIQRYYNMRYIELKTPDLVDPGGRCVLHHKPKPCDKPHTTFVPALQAAAAKMRAGRPLQWVCNQSSIRTTSALSKTDDDDAGTLGDPNPYNCSSCEGNWSVDSPLVVPSSGCPSIQAALDCAPDSHQLSEGRFSIHIKPGKYREKLTLGSTKGALLLQGMSSAVDGVVIAWDDADAAAGGGKPGCRGANRTQDNAGGEWDSQTLRVDSDDFVLANITVLNDACGFEGGARNFALMVNGDRAELVNARVYGQHDTFYTGMKRIYIKDTYINGSVDFLFGAGSAVFEHCEIVAAGGHITAHKGSATDRDGLSAPCGNSSCSTYLIRNSRLPASRHGGGEADLGRAWRSRATVVYDSVWMDSHISPQGWGTTMRGCHPTAAACPNITFAEYNSSGPGADPRRRVRWAKQLSAADMGRFTVSRVLNGWVPTSRKGLKADDTPTSAVVVNSSRVIHRTAESLVGLVFDGYTVDQGDYLRTNAWRYSNWVEANFSCPIFRHWMKALAEPSGGDLVIRIGGGPQDSVVFTGDANASFSKMVNKGHGCNASTFDYNSGNCVVLTPEHFDAMLDMCEATGCKLVFGLSGMYGACCASDAGLACPFASMTCKGDGPGCCPENELLRTMYGTGHCGDADVSTNATACQPWDSSNTLAILKHVHARPKTHWPYGFELGNELNPAAFQARSGDDLVAMFAKLASMIDEVWSDTPKAERPKVIGPDNDFGQGHYHADSALNVTGMKIMAEILHAYTYHQYGGGGEIKRASEYAGLPSFVPTKLLQEYAPNVELWLGEGGGSGCSGGPLPLPPAPSPMLSNTNKDVDRYLSALGELAKSGKTRFLRETIAGGWYGLTNLTFQHDASVAAVVYPDYYAALLFTRLLGPRVLSVSLNNSASPKLAAYAHCARDNKSTSLLLLNMDENMTTSAVLQVSGAVASSTHDIYRLSPGADAYSLKLNGVELVLGGKGGPGSLPELPPVQGSGPVVLAPLDVVFVVVPTSACGEAGAGSATRLKSDDAPTASAAGVRECTTPMDCALSGSCVAGRCLCDSGWTSPPEGGTPCSVFDLLPADPAAEGYRNTSWPSWGGHPVQWSAGPGADRKWHLFTPQFANGCTVDNW
jgi:pectin methylesterase-like acyl-CoA thioesterase